MRIELTSAAQRQLKKIRRNVKLAKRLKQALKRIGSNPYVGRKLEGEYDTVYSFRVGEWRILYEVYKNELVVLVLEIADRKEAYK